jgi:cytochrome c-type biogenesis protein CcmH/NrfG
MCRRPADPGSVQTGRKPLPTRGPTFGRLPQEHPMAKKNHPGSTHVTKQTLMTSVVLALMVGFFGGLVFGIYKTSSDLPTAQPGGGMNEEQGRARMLQALMDKVRQNPEDVASWIQLGHLHFDRNAVPEAIEAYEKALALDPNNAPVHTDLGIMYRRAKRPEDAVRSFDRAIAIDPKLENPHFNKGIVLLHDLNDREGAIRAWEELLRINPTAMAPNGQSVDQLIMHYREHEQP